MRILRGTVAFLLSLTIITASMSFWVEATSQTVPSEEEAEVILQRHGFPAIIKKMDVQQKIDLARMILKNPDAVHVSGGISHFDELAEVEAFTNLSDQELRNKGISQKEIETNRKNVEAILSATDEELMREYGRSHEEIKLIRMAMTPSEEYCNKELDGNIVTSSGYIADSSLGFYLIDASDLTVNHPCTHLAVVFEWLKEPVLALEDEMVVAWGGGLHSQNISLNCYIAPNFLKKYNLPLDSDYPTTVPYNIEKTPDCGLKYVIDIQYGNRFICGIGNLTIYKNTPRIKDDTEVIAQYAHETISLNGGITISATPSITIGWNGLGFSYSPQRHVNIPI